LANSENSSNLTNLTNLANFANLASAHDFDAAIAPQEHFSQDYGASQQAADAFEFGFYSILESAHPYETLSSFIFDPNTSTVNSIDTITPSSPSQGTDAPPTPFLQRSEVAKFTAPASSALSPDQEHSLDEFHIASTDGPQNKPSQNTRHGQKEKYFCTYPDCQRAQQGFGFKRKDNRDQHLRTTHKQISVEGIRAYQVAASGSSTPASNTESLVQSKKRKHNEDEDSDLHNVEALKTELGRMQQENLELRQKVMKYEERMERNEQRLDKLMSLFGQQNGLVNQRMERYEQQLDESLWTAERVGREG
jgi:hypothetical protein